MKTSTVTTHKAVSRHSLLTELDPSLWSCVSGGGVGPDVVDLASVGPDVVDLASVGPDVVDLASVGPDVVD